MATTDLQSGVRLFLDAQPYTVGEEKISQEIQTDVSSGDRRNSVLQQGVEIARAEIARRRRRLGRLTREQEIGIETLMVSTVTRISELVARVESIAERSSLREFGPS